MNLATAPQALLADEYELYRAAMRPVLEADLGVRVVGEAANGHDAVARIHRLKPTIALLSEGLPGLDATTVCASVKAQSHTRVVIVGDTADPASLQAAVEAGADGYVSKDMALDFLIAGVDRVVHHMAFVPPTMLGGLLRRLVQRKRRSRQVLERYTCLTKREREVLALLVEGCDPLAVAEILVISRQTARTHIQNVIGKLGVHSRLEAAALAAEHGLLGRQSVEEA